MNVVVKFTRKKKTTQLIIKLSSIILFLQINSTIGFEIISIKNRKIYPYSFKNNNKYSISAQTCEVIGRPGDCDPESCKSGRTCESRYTRFWDQLQQIDRTQKSCKCIQVSAYFSRKFVNEISKRKENFSNNKYILKIRLHLN